MLHLDACGHGPELVLLHGWGMHGGLFARWAQELSASFRVTVIDLPGHGNSGDPQPGELARWANAVLEVAPAQAAWVGWSLGGLVALAAAAAEPRRIRALTLLAATPKFVAAPDWVTAVDAAVFEQFARQLETDAGRTLSRFVALQMRGAENSGEALRSLRAALEARPLPALQTLRAGLELLQHSDQRSGLQQLDMPLFGLFGERDTLVPATLTAALPTVRSAVIKGAGHAPFVSHARQCTEQLRSWLLNDAEWQHAAS